ncbi:GNAT family N-acetyltransferase [Epibacterium ulvae]|uniref:GNAT family N-acetyltransferase n=1 Tax=Epibacterium ulvae TaxID=1156985 RepID=UPI001BFCC08B|nr:GNAT family N-acetyltransferase [Epibacterium ulvae]MBT8155232.1 GNAT family N-acetyltransferase [Epibacterium ulvae]
MTITDGITELPAGKLAAVVTYLQMFDRPETRAVTAPAGVTLQPHAAPDAEWYRTLFRLIGEDYLWFSRLERDGAELAAHLAKDSVEVWSVQKDGADLGLLELEWQAGGDCELSFFGLSPALIGGGIGRWLMNHAINRAFARPVSRFYVHTCSLDSAQALDFYVRSGFEPYRRAIELMEDPRLTGTIGTDKAPQIPLI